MQKLQANHVQMEWLIEGRPGKMYTGSLCSFLQSHVNPELSKMFIKTQIIGLHTQFLI